LLDEFERSGLSGAEFATLAGIKYQTFASWVQLRRRQLREGGMNKPAGPTADSVRWLEAVVADAQSAPPGSGVPVKVHLGSGAWVEVTEAQQVNLVVALVRALEKPLIAC
jgi:hypothetical protein